MKVLFIRSLLTSLLVFIVLASGVTKAHTHRERQIEWSYYWYSGMLVRVGPDTPPTIQAFQPRDKAWKTIEDHEWKVWWALKGKNDAFLINKESAQTLMQRLIEDSKRHPR